MEPEGSVRYVIAGNPTGWAAMAKTIRDVDEDKIKDCKEDIDTLLVFSGLFSAVLTAFVVESYQNLSPDKTDTVIQLLSQISNQTNSYTVTSTIINSTAPPAQALPAFEPPLSALRVNQLWFASLIFTLITASFGILVKQWLREYLAVDYTSPHERLRARQFRHPGLSIWKVFEIAGILPLLLQVALGLFLLGLCFFTWSVNSSVGRTSVVLVGGWAFLFTSATIAPVFSPRCPYKTALLKGVMASIRRGIRKLFEPRSMRTGLQTVSHTVSLGVLGRDELRAQLSHRPYFVEEDEAIKHDSDELSILKEVDAFLLDDDLLGTTIFDSLMQYYADPFTIIQFVVQALNIRLKGSMLVQPLTSIPDLRQLTKRGWIAVSDIVANTVLNNIGRHSANVDLWLEDAIYLFLSISDHPLTPNARTALVRCVQKSTISRFADVLGMLASSPHIARSHLYDILEPLSAHLGELLSTGEIAPPEAINLVLRVQALEMGYNVYVPLHFILDLRSLSRMVWDFTLDVIGAAILPALEIAEDDQIGLWLEDAIHILLSISQHPFTPTGEKGFLALFEETAPWGRFRACMRPAVSPENVYFPHVLSRFREVCSHISSEPSMNWLLREMILSVPCTPQCTHSNTNMSLALLVHDHLPHHEEWARHYIPILVDRIDGLFDVKSTWPPGSTFGLPALLSCPILLRSISPDTQKTLFRILSSPISSASALLPLISMEPRGRSRVQANIAMRTILSLVAEANSEGRLQFIQEMQNQCDDYLSTAIRSRSRYLEERNIIRHAVLVSNIHSHIQADSSLSQDWRKFYSKCAEAIALFRKVKYPFIDDDEKGHTIRLAEECLSVLDSLEPLIGNMKSAFDVRESLLPDELFQQLAQFITEEVSLRFKRVKRLRDRDIIRESATDAAGPVVMEQGEGQAVKTDEDRYGQNSGDMALELSPGGLVDAAPAAPAGDGETKSVVRVDTTSASHEAISSFGRGLEGTDPDNRGGSISTGGPENTELARGDVKSAQ